METASEWEYESCFPKLYNGLIGAVLKEVLRLNSPVLTIPKSFPLQPSLSSLKARVSGSLLGQQFDSAFPRFIAIPNSGSTVLLQTLQSL